MIFLLKLKEIILKGRRSKKVLFLSTYTMHQSSLLTSQDLEVQNIQWEMVNANFRDLGESTYEVALEISSQKFMVKMVRGLDDILAFEIIAVKGFMEITTRAIECLKKLVQHLREMLD